MLLLAIVSFTEINDVFWGQMEQQITGWQKKSFFPHLVSNEIEKSTRWITKKGMKISPLSGVCHSKHISQQQPPTA